MGTNITTMGRMLCPMYIAFLTMIFAVEINTPAMSSWKSLISIK